MRNRLIIGVVLLALTTAGTARADIRLAYVDIQRALNLCRAGKDAKGDFRGRIERLQSQLEGQQSEVERLKDELQKKGALMQPISARTSRTSTRASCVSSRTTTRIHATSCNRKTARSRAQSCATSPPSFARSARKTATRWCSRRAVCCGLSPRSTSPTRSSAPTTR